MNFSNLYMSENRNGYPLQICCLYLLILFVTSVCISGYLDLSVNFMAARNPDILKRKSGCCGCL